MNLLELMDKVDYGKSYPFIHVIKVLRGVFSRLKVTRAVFPSINPLKLE